MKIDITCKKAVDFISKKEESRLTGWQRFQLWRHLAVCSLCRRFDHQNRCFAHLKNESPQRLSESNKRNILDTVLKEIDSGND